MRISVIQCKYIFLHLVKPLYSGHQRDLEKVSAMRRCPLYRGLTDDRWLKKNKLEAVEKELASNVEHCLKRSYVSSVTFYSETICSFYF